MSSSTIEIQPQPTIQPQPMSVVASHQWEPYGTAETEDLIACLWWRTLGREINIRVIYNFFSKVQVENGNIIINLKISSFMDSPTLKSELNEAVFNFSINDVHTPPGNHE